MAEDNITSHSINLLLIGLVVLGLISAFVLLVNNEGRGSVFDNYTEIENFNLNLTSAYTGQLLDTANTNANLSASYDPTLSDSGADQTGNAIAINLQTISFSIVGLLSIFGSLLFGNVWVSFISIVLTGIISYLFTYYTIKFIRTGT